MSDATPRPGPITPRVDAFFKALCIYLGKSDAKPESDTLTFAAQALRGFEYSEHVRRCHPDRLAAARALGLDQISDVPSRKAWTWGYDFEVPS